MANFQDSYLGESAALTHLQQVLDLTTEHNYLAMLGASSVRALKVVQEAEDGRGDIIRVPAALLAPEDYKAYLTQKFNRLMERNSQLKREREELKKTQADPGQAELIKDLMASLEEVKQNFAKSEEARKEGEEMVRLTLEELDSVKLSIAQTVADWEKEKAYQNFVVKQKDAAITHLKGLVNKNVVKAEETLKTIADGFENNLASYAAVGYYFANLAHLSANQSPLDLAPSEVPQEHIDAMKTFYLKCFSWQSDQGGAEGGAEGER